MGEAAAMVSSRNMMEETVIEILKASDFETATELSIRTIAAERLGVDSFDLDQKRLIRTIIESFLLSSESATPVPEELVARGGKIGVEVAARGGNKDVVGGLEGAARGRNKDGGNGVKELEVAALGRNKDGGNGVKELEVAARVTSKDGGGGGVKEVEMAGRVIKNGDCDGVNQEGGGGDYAQNSNSRIICELSQSRDVTVHHFKGQSVVRIRDFYPRDGMLSRQDRGVSLTGEQWLSIKNNIPTIEEAITRMQSRLRLPAAGKPTDPHASRPVADSDQANVTEYSKQMDSFYSAQESIAEGSKQMELETILPSSGLMHMPIRLDGTNYYLWKHQMEFSLAELKIAYVLTEACPSISITPPGTRKEMDQAKASTQKWVNDDFICRNKILTCLSDNLYNDYSWKSGNAKELWEELKSVYDEDIGTRRSEINKYVQFQIVDSVSILQQVHELQSIANSISASGTRIEEYFHVSFIISKLPPSWKEFRLKMMRIEVLPLDMLMHYLKVEEDACKAKQLGKHSKHGEGSKCESKAGSQNRETKRICYHCKKGGHISKNCRDKKTYVWDNGSSKETGRGPKGDRSYNG